MDAEPMTDWERLHAVSQVQRKMLEDRLRLMTERNRILAEALDQIADMTCDNPAAPGVAADALAATTLREPEYKDDPFPVGMF